MTLSVLEGNSPIASLFKYDIAYLWRVARSLCICRASCRVMRASDRFIDTQADIQTDVLTLCGLTGGTSPWGLGLCGPCRIHKKNPSLFFRFYQACPWKSWLMLPTSTVSWSRLFHLFTTLLEKKYLLTSFTLCFFFNLNVCPLVPLIFASLSNTHHNTSQP